MPTDEKKSYQLRVRVSPEEREFLEKLGVQRGRGETISDLVREAIGLLMNGGASSGGSQRPSAVQARVEELAVLLKRDPRQIEEACVEGILDLIAHRCEVPLIVMETQLHQKYRGREETSRPTAP